MGAPWLSTPTIPRACSGMAGRKKRPKLNAAERSYRRLLALKQSGPESREVYWARHRLGDIEQSRGRLDPALASYRAAQSSADRLAKAAPGNADWQCVSKKNAKQQRRLTCCNWVGRSWCV
jgi:hypothetical protein